MGLWSCKFLFNIFIIKGNIEVETTYLQKRLIITITILQYIILNTIEKLEKISVNELIERIGEKDYITLADLNALLFSPSFNPKRLLTSGLISSNMKESEKELNNNHIISINKNFEPLNLKLNCLPGLYKKPIDEAKQQEQQEAQNLKAYHNMIIDAYLTRIMKGRIGKKTTHLELVNECSKQIEIFVAQPSQIKDRIENLIEKQILRRDENDHSKYHYIS
jgi:hypothetical protein